MVESGQGISIMPELVLDYLGGNIRVFPIEGAPFRTIGIATQRSEYVTPVTKIFVRTVPGLCGAAISRRAALLPLSAAEN